MKRVSLSFTASLAVVSLILGISIGYYISPTYQQTMYDKSNMEMGFGMADRFVDLRYINAMASHHQGAIVLAQEIESKTTRSELRDLAQAIQAGEPKLINQLYQWKLEWYNDPRKAKDPIVPNLGPADEQTDLRFLNALIAHHEEGIVMTKEIKTKTSRKEILDDADAVETFLSNSLVTLKTWRTQWYNI